MRDSLGSWRRWVRRPTPVLPTVIELEGPVGEALLEDQTLQVAPEWGENDYWTATWNPLYVGEPGVGPYQSILVWLDVPAGETARLRVTTERPPEAGWHCVLTTNLSIYRYGLFAAIGQRVGPYDPTSPRIVVDVPLPEGEHSLKVWVDAARREAVRNVAMVLTGQVQSADA